MAGKLFLVAAPSGTGKTTLVTQVIERIGSEYRLHRLITYTTKKPRVNEVSGIDYHFIDEAEFLDKIQQGFFIEWSTAYGAYYGSPACVLKDVEEGRSVIAILDCNGVAAFKKWYDQAITIWLQPPTLEALVSRLSLRATETPDQLAHRIELAKREISAQESQGVFRYKIINENLEKALQELEMIIRLESLNKI